MIRYNISGCPILCFRFCVSIPMRHFDDLKLHNFTRKWEIKNFPDGLHFPHLHGMVIGEDSSWCDWKASVIKISVRGTHEYQKCDPSMWNSFQCKICVNEAKMPKAYFYKRNFSHQQKCNIKSYKGQMHSMVSCQPVNAAHRRQCKICSYEAKIQLQVIKNNTNLATYTIFLKDVQKTEGASERE